MELSMSLLFCHIDLAYEYGHDVEDEQKYG